MNKVKENPTSHSTIMIHKICDVRRYLFLGLLLATTSVTYTYEEEQVNQEITRTVEQTAEEITQQEIDQELFEIFHKFFDEKDTTPFTKIINKIIALLKLKKATFNDDQKKQCEEIITSFEKNRHNSNPVVWGAILKDPNLYNLIPEKSKAYINSIPAMKKLQTLIYKLKNNFYSFF
ncbi:MAG: hypothetical protein Q8Q60_02325 [Candidatus Chromulinivorax sp.]|nr:hypothetical protein [Candidatus Chromulinivorax sp.]